MINLQQNKHILVKQKSVLSQISIDNISYIKCDAEVSTIHFISDRPPVIVSRILKKFEDELKDYGFERVHHNVLVNVLKIQELKKTKVRQVTMINGDILLVSARKFTNVKKKMLGLYNTYLD